MRLSGVGVNKFKFRQQVRPSAWASNGKGAFLFWALLVMGGIGSHTGLAGSSRMSNSHGVILGVVSPPVASTYSVSYRQNVFDWLSVRAGLGTYCPSIWSGQQLFLTLPQLGFVLGLSTRLLIPEIDVSPFVGGGLSFSSFNSGIAAAPIVGLEWTSPLGFFLSSGMHWNPRMLDGSSAAMLLLFGELGWFF